MSRQTIAPFLIGELVYPVVRGSEYDACGCCGGDKYITGRDGRNYPCPNCKGSGQENQRPANWEVGERVDIREIRVNHGGTFVVLPDHEFPLPIAMIFEDRDAAEKEATRRNSARRIGAS